MLRLLDLKLSSVVAVYRCHNNQVQGSDDTVTEDLHWQSLL